MRSITLQDIKKSYYNKLVLAGVSFTLSEGKKLSIVGENGAGKSTLLKIITGITKPDEGEIFGGEIGCAYIAQDFSGNEEETPYEFLTKRIPPTSLGKASKFLCQSGFDTGKDDSRLKQISCGRLSGGEKKKLEIVAGLSCGSLFVAMDEPENHLDDESVQWLIETLSKFHGGLLMVSHDNYFIDQLTNTVLELKDGVITSYTMKYHEYLEEKARQIEGTARGWIIEEKTIKRLQKTVEIMKLQARNNASRAATYQQKKRELKVTKEKHGNKPSSEQKKPKVNLSSVEQKKGKMIVSIDHLDFSYEIKSVFVDTTADLRFGERVVLFGSNGAGKTTLIKLIKGELTPKKGTARIGVNVSYQMMTQDHLEGLNAQKTALEVFGDILEWSTSRCRALLAQYGINVDLVTRPLEVLSGGQQARFKLALTFAQDPEFLILDEPTNHVDPSTWEAIVRSIKSYRGTVLAITHDREFIEAIAEKLWIIENKKIIIEYGTLDDYFNRNEET